MVRSPSVDKTGFRRGAWSEEEDNKLRDYVLRYGHWNWHQLPKFAGLARCGKSCRLRWLNYLRPGLKRGEYSKEEVEMIIKLHEELGNKWSAIAEKLPGRTDNEIKNYWHTHLKKRMKQDPKSTERINGRCQTMHSMDQKDQDSSIFSLESTDEKMESDPSIAAADASTQEILSSSHNYFTLLDGMENLFSSEESFPEFFESFWTEPFSPSTSHSQMSSFTSCSSTVLSLEDWGIESSFSLEESFVKSLENFSTEPVFSTASNVLISPSTSSDSKATNSKELSANAFSIFWTEPIFSNASDSVISSSTSCNYTDIKSEGSSADVFSSFWTEPIFSDASNSLISPSTTCESTVTYFEESSAEDFHSFWTEPILSYASNGQTLPSTCCNSIVTNSDEASADAFGVF